MTSSPPEATTTLASCSYRPGVYSPLLLISNSISINSISAFAQNSEDNSRLSSYHILNFPTPKHPNTKPFHKSRDRPKNSPNFNIT